MIKARPSYRLACSLFALSLGLSQPVLATPSHAVEIMPQDVRPITSTTTQKIDIAATLERAQAAYKAENYFQSAKDYQAVYVHDPAHFAARIGLGNAALALGQGELAFDIFEDLHAHSQTSSNTQAADIFSGYILAEIMTNRSEDIEVRINDALEVTRTDPRLWNALGRELDRQARWEAAQNAYIKALETGRAHSAIINNLGMSLLLQGRRAEALTKFQHAVNLNPHKHLYDNNRRLTHLLLDEYSQALKPVSGDINLSDSQAADLFNDAGYIAMQSKNFDRAQSLLERAVSLSPHYHETAYKNLETLRSLQKKPT